jgi:hypothetical protein
MTGDQRMKSVMKELFVAVVLVSLSALFFQLPSVFADEEPIADIGLEFIKDVAMIDVTKYDVKISDPSIDYRSSRGGIPTAIIRYDLKSSESELHLFIKFTNGNLHSFRLYNDKGSPIYKQNPSTILDDAKETLERLQNVSKVTYQPELTNILHAVNSDATNDTLTSDNVKLSILIQGDSGTVDLVYVANGVEYTKKSVRMTFSSGRLTFFGNGWNIYSVGNTNLNVSVEEAINKSIQRAQSHKLVFDEGEKPFTLAVDKTNMELWTIEREPLTLQLAWHAKIPFEQPVYGVYGLEVGLWADTGEIYSFGVLSAAGLPSGPSWSPPPETTNENPLDAISDDLPDDTNDEISQDMTPVLLVLAVVSSVLIAVAVFYNVRRTTSNKN